MQLKAWLLGISPMVWRRLQISAESNMRQLHGVIQVAMGREGIVLHQFRLRAARYGPRELSTSSAEVWDPLKRLMTLTTTTA